MDNAEQRAQEALGLARVLRAAWEEGELADAARDLVSSLEALDALEGLQGRQVRLTTPREAVQRLESLWGLRVRDALESARIPPERADLRRRAVEALDSVGTRALSSAPGGLVVDPFAGSGSTLLAARSLGRSALGWEIDPQWHTRATQRLAGALRRDPEGLTLERQPSLFGGAR